MRNTSIFYAQVMMEFGMNTYIPTYIDNSKNGNVNNKRITLFHTTIEWGAHSYNIYVKAVRCCWGHLMKYYKRL